MRNITPDNVNEWIRRGIDAAVEHGGGTESVQARIMMVRQLFIQAQLVLGLDSSEAGMLRWAAVDSILLGFMGEEGHADRPRWADMGRGSLWSSWCMVFQFNPGKLDSLLEGLDEGGRVRLANAFIHSLATCETEFGSPGDIVFDDGVESGGVVDLSEAESEEDDPADIN